MKKIILLLVLLSTIFFTGCEKEDIQDENNVSNNEIKNEMENDPIISDVITPDQNIQLGE